MSQRYLGGWIQDGLFNPLAAPTPSAYTYELWSWGYNPYGKLGLGNTTYYSSPKQVGALTNWGLFTATGSASQNNSITVVKTNGTLWSWGFNNYGQLGTGNRTSFSFPLQIGALTTWAFAQTSNTFCATVAIKTDGTLWSWGYNAFGGLGLNNRTDYSSPKQVGSLTTWSKVSTAGRWALAVQANGTLWSWGYNTMGQLGLGNTTNYSSPKQVGALTNWLNVSSGLYHALALKTDGTLWSWGSNSSGELGLGNTTGRSSPVQVGALTTWSKITACGQTSNGSSFGIRSDSTLWGWGNNSSNQLNLPTGPSSPTQVGAPALWTSVACSGYHTLAIKTDGTLWSWGSNDYGQLGLGNITAYSSAKQVGALTTWASVYANYKSSFALKY